jgi:large subunit ribosomal protein L3
MSDLNGLPFLISHTLQDPGRVFPGKKMAGRLGGEQVTTQNLYVMRIDTALNLIFVKGCVPGSDDAQVYVTDAKKKVVFAARAKKLKGKETFLPLGVEDLPFPAGTKELAEELPSIVVAPTRGRNPFIPQE